MTALDFPDSPTNGQVYENYVYDSTAGVWKRLTPGGILNGLDDVNITTPADGQALVYNSGDWVNETPASTISSLTDTTVTSAASGDQLVYNGSAWVNRPEPGRNLLYNGAMQVHQRGTSATGIANTQAYYTADRWSTLIILMGTWTQTIENDAPSGSGFRKSLKVLCTTADAAPDANDQIRLDQYLEGQDLQNIRKGTAEAKPLTMSFWVKSNVTGTYIVRLADNDNSRGVSASYTVNVSATWEKKIITFPADTTGAFDNDNASSLQVRWYLGAGSNLTSGTLATAWATSVADEIAVGQTNLAAAVNNYWQVTGVQLEVGPVATPFEFKAFGQELLECQRYFYAIRPITSNHPMTNGTYWATGEFYGVVSHPVFMRVSPSFSTTNSSWSTLSAGSTRVATSIVLFTGGNTASTINFTTSGGTTGQGGWVNSNASFAPAFFDAEM
jgi:hypothetical protein